MIKKNHLPRWLKDVMYCLSDIITVILSVLIVLTVYHGFHFLHSEFFPQRFMLNILVLAFFTLILFLLGGIYRRYWKTATLMDFARLFFTNLFVLFPTIPLSVIFTRNLLPWNYVFWSVLLCSVGMTGYRLLIYIYNHAQTAALCKSGNNKNLLVVGAGEAGRIVVHDIFKNPNFNYNVVGFIDDDISKKNRIIEGVQVLGTSSDILRICKQLDVSEILYAIPSANETVTQRILNVCSETGCKVRIVPSIDEILAPGSKNFTKKIRDVEIEDLLARDPIILDNHGLSQEITGKVIMVTGGGGSIGSELCKQIAVFKPSLLVIVDIYENNAYDLENELHYLYPDLNTETLIASVRDKHRIDSICKTYKPYTIFHAAAHKHVPLMEDSPCEAIKNNVFGTLNMVQCASENNIPKFVMISTDKAVNPTNVMGATKRLCEMIIQSYQKKSGTNFVAVRFGNVLGSNGSVIPLFKRQIAHGGPVTVTHREITRFFMTIPEAAQLVLQASLYAKGGEIFVLDMGQPVKIYDLAVNLIRLSGYVPNKDIDIKVTGLRPGEKLYEELLMAEEGLSKTAHNKIFVGRPSFTEFDVLYEKLKDLYTAAHNEDAAKTKELLMEIVPTYKPVNNK